MEKYSLTQRHDTMRSPSPLLITIRRCSLARELRPDEVAISIRVVSTIDENSVRKLVTLCKISCQFLYYSNEILHLLLVLIKRSFLFKLLVRVSNK